MKSYRMWREIELHAGLIAHPWRAQDRLTIGA